SEAGHERREHRAHREDGVTEEQVEHARPGHLVEETADSRQKEQAQQQRATDGLERRRRGVAASAHVSTGGGRTRFTICPTMAALAWPPSCSFWHRSVKAQRTDRYGMRRFGRRFDLRRSLAERSSPNARPGSPDLIARALVRCERLAIHCEVGNSQDSAH